MNRNHAIPLFLAVAFAAAAAFAAPHRIAVVVQDHTSGALPVPAEALADTFAALLSGTDFAVVNPANRIGTNQNRSAAGESIPDAAAMELANLLGVEGVLTASVQEFTSQSIGIPSVGRTLKARIALNLADGATGATICGATARDYSHNYTTGQWEADAEALREDFLHEAATAAATRFLDVYRESKGWKPTAPETVTVFFGCNVLGADIQIDGLSYGTCPSQIAVTPGVHQLLVSYPPYYLDFDRRAMFNTDGQTYAVVLQITPEGEEQRRSGELFEKQKALFDAELARFEASGKTEDYVRRTIANGTAVYWKNSYGRIAITEGSTDNIEFTTPQVDSATLQDAPSTAAIARKLQELLSE